MTEYNSCGDPGILSQAELHALFGCGPMSEPPIFSQTAAGKDLFDRLHDFIYSDDFEKLGGRVGIQRPTEGPDPILNAYAKSVSDWRCR